MSKPKPKNQPRRRKNGSKTFIFKSYSWFSDIKLALNREQQLSVAFDRLEILGRLHPHYKEEQIKINKELGDIARFLDIFGIDYKILI